MRKIAVIIFFLGSYLFADSIKENLNKIPKRERRYLEYFFRDFVYTSNLAFIFLDYKPASLNSHILYAPNYCYFNRSANTSSIKGWEIFKKNEHLFSHPNYLFTEEIRDQGIIKVRDILCINKISLLNVLIDHKKRFIEKLGNSFSPEKFIKDIEEKKCLFSLINDDDELLGIILGFGAESSRNFVECHEKLIGFDSTGNTYSKINGVVFKGLPHSKEANELMDRYHQQQEQLCNFYRQRDFLEATLLLLCQSH